MNKKEIAEIKKQFTPERCAISRICGCYVDGDKNKKMEMGQSFLTLSEEEIHKYLDIFRKTLSGTLGKNLINLDFPLEQEKEGGFQKFLLDLRQSELEDEEKLEQFYDSIIEHYDYGENYLILLILSRYDVPGKSSDNLMMEDASEEVYTHLLCSICPVNLSKAGLSYNAEANVIEDRIRDWVVEMPATGFLFPAFQDRSTDIHSLLYYSKNSEKLFRNLIEEVFGCDAPLSAGTQKDSFQALVENTLGNACAYDTVVTIHEKLNEILEDQKDLPDPVVLTKPEVRRILEESGAGEDAMESFDEQYQMAAGSTDSLMAANLTNPKRMEVRTPDVVIQVEPSKAELIETRDIEGRRCLVIPLEGDVEINGIHVK